MHTRGVQGADILSAKSSEMNVSCPDPSDPDADYVSPWLLHPDLPVCLPLLMGVLQSMRPVPCPRSVCCV